MKNLTHLTLLASAVALMTGMPAKAVTYPDKTYNVTLNLANLTGYSLSAPFSLDLQLAEGSGNVSNTVTLSNFVLVGGTASGTPDYTSGNETGSLASSVVLTSSVQSPNLFDEFAEAISSGVTSISFHVDQTPNGEEVTKGTPVPEQFNVSILDTNLNPIPTTDPSGGDTLVNSDLGPITTVNTYAIEAAPEPGTTSLFLAAAAMCGAVAFWRRQMA